MQMEKQVFLMLISFLKATSVRVCIPMDEIYDTFFILFNLMSSFPSESLHLCMGFFLIIRLINLLWIEDQI